MKSLATESSAPLTSQPADALSRGFARIRQRVADFFTRGALADDLLDLERRGLLDALLGDMGLSYGELTRLVRGYPEAGRLLPAMAKRLGIDIESLDPRTRYALQQNCALCSAHRRCRRFLAASAEEGVDPGSFCPNTGLFDGAREPGQGI